MTTYMMDSAISTGFTSEATSASPEQQDELFQNPIDAGAALETAICVDDSEEASPTPAEDSDPVFFDETQVDQEAGAPVFKVADCDSPTLHDSVLEEVAALVEEEPEQEIFELDDTPVISPVPEEQSSEECPLEQSSEEDPAQEMTLPEEDPVDFPSSKPMSPIREVPELSAEEEVMQAFDAFNHTQESIGNFESPAAVDAEPAEPADDVLEAPQVVVEEVEEVCEAAVPIPVVVEAVVPMKAVSPKKKSAGKARRSSMSGKKAKKPMSAGKGRRSSKSGKKSAGKGRRSSMGGKKSKRSPAKKTPVSKKSKKGSKKKTPVRKSSKKGKKGSSKKAVRRSAKKPRMSAKKRSASKKRSARKAKSPARSGSKKRARTPTKRSASKKRAAKRTKVAA